MRGPVHRSEDEGAVRVWAGAAMPEGDLRTPRNASRVVLIAD